MKWNQLSAEKRFARICCSGRRFFWWLLALKHYMLIWGTSENCRFA